MKTESKGKWPRVILLADMNAFFASVEQVDHPEWRAKPVALTNGGIGTCIITCSYEARACGVKTGMHIKQARRLCPQLIQVASRPQRYAQVSANIMHALAGFTPDIEIFSVDEAFLDVTRCQQLWGSPREIAKRVKHSVYENSGVLCSVGVSGDKTTAKFAAKQQKPDGLTIIPPWQAKERLASTPLIELCGINSGVAGMLADYGVHCCADLQKLPISVLGKRFGNPGRRIWLMAQGLDPEPVKTSIPSAQSIGHGKVLPPNTRNAETIRVFMMHMAHKLAERLRSNKLVAQQFLFGLRLYRGWLKTTARSLLPCDDEMVIYRLGNHWLQNHWRGQGIWQIRIVALDPKAPRQADLFQRKHPLRQRAHLAMDQVNQRYGAMTLASARLLGRSTMPDVISPAWKPYGHRKTV
ncbi:MAG: DNA polymerase IV [Gammaproteobacteria bacterium]|nr:DNA polymerase IV [Gammaproteobacteria bacterium]